MTPSRKNEDQVTMASCSKTLPRQLCPPRTSAHYRLSIGSAFSAPSNSSKEEQVSVYLPEGDRERKNLEILNNTLSVISEGRLDPFPKYVDCLWTSLSGASKEEITVKAHDMVFHILNTIAPSQQEQLWDSLLAHHCSGEHKLTIDTGLEAILLAYCECSNHSTKIQILSLISDRFSQYELQQLLPGVLLRQIKNARTHSSEKGHGEPKIKAGIVRCRLNMGKVRDFIEFVSRSIFLQDVAFGTETLKLSSGEKISIPAVVGTITISKIVYLYQEACRSLDVEPLKERTCFRLLEVCSASKQKSLHGLDNISTPGITKYNNFSLTNKGMRVWQAYNMGHGMDIEGPFHEQDVSGLERIGDWTKETRRCTQKKSKPKEGQTTDQYAHTTYSCLEPTCVLTFKTLQEADEHLDVGCHVMAHEKDKKENIYDTVRRQWAQVTTSVKGASQKIGMSDYVDVPDTDQMQRKGWVLKKQKATVRISQAVKEYLTEVFNKGSTDIHDKAKPADVVEKSKETFPSKDWIEAQTVKGYFSRLAAQQKGLQLSEVDEGEDEALEKEQYLDHLIGAIEQEMIAKHPLAFNDFNLCELSAKGSLAKTLKKQKLCELQSLSSFFDLEITGQANRRASYYGPILELASSCDCFK